MFYEHSCKSLYVHIQEHNMLTVFSKARFLNLHTLQNLDSEFFTVRACPVNYSIFRAFLFFFFFSSAAFIKVGPRLTWSWCTWSRPWCPRTQRAWPAPQAAADARPSGPPGMSVWFDPSTGPAGRPRRPAAQTDRSRTSS